MNVMQSVLQRTLSFFKGTQPKRPVAETGLETSTPTTTATPDPEAAVAPAMPWEQQIEQAIEKRVEGAGPRDVIVVPAGFAGKVGDRATSLELKSVRNAAKVTLGY